MINCLITDQFQENPSRQVNSCGSYIEASTVAFNEYANIIMVTHCP